MMQTKDTRQGGIKAAIVGALAGYLGRPVALTDGGFWSQWLHTHNFSGKHVTVNSALQLSTAWACVRLISETLSTLPLNLYQQKGNIKTVATDHRLYGILHTQPHYDMTAAVFWQTYIASMLLWGGAYVEKIFTGGAVSSLEFLQPAYVAPRRMKNGAIEWHYNDPTTGIARVIPERSMWFTPAFTLDGLTGLSPISMGANVFGGAIASDEASANTFRHGMKASGLVTMDAVLKQDQRNDIREHVGRVSRDGGIMVLEKGSGFQQLTMTPQDAELLATRAFNIEEICRWFRVPPFMIGHAEKSTSWGTGIEQQMIGFVTFVLRPWAVRIEQSIRKGLLDPSERAQYSAEFALEGLLRGDSAARSAFYSTSLQNGWMTRNEVRRLENLPPVAGGDALTVQANMMGLDQVGQVRPSAIAAAGKALQDSTQGAI